MIATRTHCFQAQGERDKLLGMELAAIRKECRIKAAQLALLNAIVGSPDGTATLDDATADLGEAFRDGGKWRGTVTRSLALEKVLRKVGVELSIRPSRHRGYLSRWEGRDLAATEAKRDELRQWLADHPPGPEPGDAGLAQSLFESPFTPPLKNDPPAATSGHE